MTQEERPRPMAKHDGAADDFTSGECAGSEVRRESVANLYDATVSSNTSGHTKHTTAITRQLDPAIAHTGDENTKPKLSTLTMPDGQTSPLSDEAEREGTGQPNGTILDPPHSEATTSAAAPPPHYATDALPASISDEKMPVMVEEPPHIQPVKTALGMSATSGPLEDYDYPEGGVEMR
jgi:hypothetical protein